MHTQSTKTLTRCDHTGCAESIVVVLVPHREDRMPTYALCADHLKQYRASYAYDLCDVVMALATPERPIELPLRRLTHY